MILLFYMCNTWNWNNNNNNNNNNNRKPMMLTNIVFDLQESVFSASSLFGHFSHRMVFSGVGTFSQRIEIPLDRVQEQRRRQETTWFIQDQTQEQLRQDLYSLASNEALDSTVTSTCNQNIQPISSIHWLTNQNALILPKF